MPTLTRYASRQFFLQLTLALVGLVMLLQLLDLLNNAPDVLQRHGNDVLALLKYMALRLPDAMTVLMPFSILLACLMSLSRLAFYNEVLALKAAGMPYHRLLMAFAPSVLAASAVHLAVSDQLSPIAARALIEWDGRQTGSDLEGKDEQKRPDAVWIHDGERTVRVNLVLDDGRTLIDMTQFKRDQNRNLTALSTAQRARYLNGRWTLYGVENLNVSQGQGGAYSRAATAEWQTELTPGHFSDMAAVPSSLSFLELWRFAAVPGIGSHATYFYETWLYKRLSIPAAALLMLLLAAPVAQGMLRQGGMASGVAVGIGLGFLYFVTDGFVLALGTAGAIPPMLAAWSPGVLFGSIGATALLRMEGH